MLVNVVGFLRVESLTALQNLWLFQQIFPEKSSTKVYSGKISESMPAGKFLPVNFPNKLTVNHLLKFGNALHYSWVQRN